MRKLYDWAVNISFVKSLMKIKLFEKLLDYEVLLYIFFGVLTTIVNFVSFILLDKLIGKEPIINIFGRELEGGVLLVNFLAWFICVTFAYVTNKLYVFDSKSWKPVVVARELMSFYLARLITLGFETVGLILLYEVLSINKLVSKVILTVFVLVLNYFFSKLLIFKKKGSSANDV